MRRILFIPLLLVSSILVAQFSPSAHIEPPSDVGLPRVRLGQPTRAMLRAGTKATTVVDWYSIDLSRDAAVEVFLSSDDFDAYLIAILPDGSRIENDDSILTNSLLTLRSEQGGRAVIGVTSFGFSETGSYVLEVRESNAATMRVGESTNGTLTDEYARFMLEGEPETVAEIVLFSDSFDTFLELEDSAGAFLSNDDAGSTSVSRLVYEFGNADQVIVTVSSYDGVPTNGGRFTLSATPLDLSELFVPDGYELRDGEIVETMAVAGPGQIMAASRFEFDARGGEKIIITMVSDELDSFLEVTSPTGQTYSDDDSGGGYDSMLEMVAPETGRYEVFAGALDRQTAGRFSISLDRRGRVTMLLDDVGELTAQDEEDITGKRYDVHSFYAESGESISIEVTSSDFDAYMILRGPDEDILLQVDDSGASTNPRGSFVANTSGEYQLVVTSYGAGEYGSYSLMIYN